MSTDRTPETKMLLKVEPQPHYIESSGRWCWPLPQHVLRPGCCTEVVTASREWWEYAPSEAKPHPYAQGVRLLDDVWYWAVPAEKTPADNTQPVKSPRLICYHSGCQYEVMSGENKRLRARITELETAMEAVRSQIGKSLRLLA